MSANLLALRKAMTDCPKDVEVITQYLTPVDLLEDSRNKMVPEDEAWRTGRNGNRGSTLRIRRRHPLQIETWRSYLHTNLVVDTLLLLFDLLLDISKLRRIRCCAVCLQHLNIPDIVNSSSS